MIACDRSRSESVQTNVTCLPAWSYLCMPQNPAVWMAGHASTGCTTQALEHIQMAASHIASVVLHPHADVKAESLGTKHMLVEVEACGHYTGAITASSVDLHRNQQKCFRSSELNIWDGVSFPLNFGQRGQVPESMYPIFAVAIT